MATEKLIHLTFKNPALAKDEKARKWLDKMEEQMNSEENIKNYEEAVVDAACYGVAFAVQNLENKILKKTRLDPKDIFIEAKPTSEQAFKERKSLFDTMKSYQLGNLRNFVIPRREDFLQIPQPLKIGMRVKSPRLSSHLTEWYLDSIDHEKNSCVVKGISPRWDTPLRVLITNINEITEWTQN